MQPEKPEQPKSREWVRPLGLLFTVGWYVALSVVIPTGIGYWLDLPEQFNRKPLFTLIGFGFGTILAFYGLYRMLRRYYIEQKEQINKKELDNT
ncbi:AtpZ/AtpI family protein [Chloroflexota bacterium]